MASPMRARTMAYLGPPGTYGEQAATRFARRLGGGLELVPCPTIKSIYTHPADYLVMPLENTLHGAVLETVDSLLSCLGDTGPSSQQSQPQSSPPQSSQPPQPSSTAAPKPNPPQPLSPPRAVSDTKLRIAHQLVALPGVTLSDIRWVRSHEQALGQSAAWLDRHLPRAERVKWASTAGAAKSLIDEGARDGAAICSKAAVGGLSVLKDGTQGVSDNYTRFLLLTRLSEAEAAAEIPAAATQRGTNVALYACRSPAEVGSVTSGATLVATHARPAPPGVRGDGLRRAFPQWTLVEVEGDGAEVAGAALVGRFSSRADQEESDADDVENVEVPAEGMETPTWGLN